MRRPPSADLMPKLTFYFAAAAQLEPALRPAFTEVASRYAAVLRGHRSALADLEGPKNHDPPWRARRALADM